MNDSKSQPSEKPLSDSEKIRESNPFKSPLTHLIDDHTHGRFDKRKSSLYYEQYFTEGHQARLRAKAHKKMIQGIEKNTPGQTLKDMALYSAAKSVRLNIQTPVKAIIKRTTLFNRLLVKLDKILGYGKPLSPEEWWRKKLPTYGIDTRH